jgi:hypothetical protein
MTRLPVIVPGGSRSPLHMWSSADAVMARLEVSVPTRLPSHERRSELPRSTSLR